MEKGELTPLGRIQSEGNEILRACNSNNGKLLHLVEVKDARWQKLFDDGLDISHYAGSCQRVGRCMRLAISEQGRWVGGIVLGSPFPNVLARDEVVGLRKYVVDYRERGLASPWSRRNRPYWEALQKVVNHARTFIFPEFRGRGIATCSHGLMATEGIALWKVKYGGDVMALDALCSEKDSELYRRNAWIPAGRTKGFASIPGTVFSKSLAKFKRKTFGARNNVALRPGNVQWMVWVKVVDPSVYRRSNRTLGRTVMLGSNGEKEL
jgi:hypothetical protein